MQIENMDNLNNFNIYMLDENLEDYEFIVQFNESNDLHNPYETNISDQLSTQIRNQPTLSHIIVP